MSRDSIDFTTQPPPELRAIEDKLIEFYRWSKMGLCVDMDASGIGKHYEPERGDQEDKRQPVMPKIRDDEAMDISRALARVPRMPVDWHMILRVQYLRQFQPPQVMCRKIKGVRAQTWCAERNKALHMLENIIKRGEHRVPIRMEHVVSIPHTPVPQIRNAPVRIYAISGDLDIESLIQPEEIFD